MTRNISNVQDIIDSLDVIERLKELESERESLQEAVDSAAALVDEHAEREPETDDEAAQEAFVERRDYLQNALDVANADLEEWDADDDQGQELERLKALNEEGEAATSEWPHGATLIREDHFEDYCREVLVVGDLPRDLPGYIEIDWEKTAQNLVADYAEVDYDGQTYYVR